MRFFGDMTAEQRARFESIPRVHDDAGEELSRLAFELQDKTPTLTFERALERVMETRPDLAVQYINLDDGK